MYLLVLLSCFKHPFLNFCDLIRIFTTNQNSWIIFIGRVFERIKNKVIKRISVVYLDYNYSH
jgi:hypothetical protein